MRRKSRLNCTYIKKAWQQRVQGHNGPTVTNPTVSADEQSSSASQDDYDDGGSDFTSVHRTSKRSFRGCLTELGRGVLKNTLHSKGAGQQVTRIEDLCHTHVSHKRLSAEKVRTPHDHVTNVQKRPGNRTWTGFGQCRLCGSILDHPTGIQTCSTAEATRGHYACLQEYFDGLKLADPGITTEPRGLTASQPRPPDILTTAAVPGRSAALDVCVCGLLQRSSSPRRRRVGVI